MEEKIQSVFPIGEKNEAFGRYFTGQRNSPPGTGA